MKTQSHSIRPDGERRMFRAALAAALVAFAPSVALAAHGGTLLTPDAYKWLAELRAATAPLHDIDAGVAAGWDTPISACMESAEGGMGYHYGNLGALLDGGQVEPLRPEALMYEPQANGRMRLVGVEYIITGEDLPPTSPAPELHGQYFHYNAGLGVWVLHAWIWRHNESGLFQDWNPDVTCAFAG